MHPARPALDPQQEASLIRKVQDGDLEAFGPLVDQHLVHVRAFIALRAPALHLVDDVAHETFVFAFRNLRQFEAGTSLAKWLRAIAWNLLRAETKRFGREQARHAETDAWDLEWAAVEPESEPEPAPDAEFLADCLRQLPAPMRELVTFKYSEDLSGEDIAQRLQRSTAWVWTTLFRVRQQLRECIERKREARPSC
jgi:RNA polymerase sigma-70 factor (ECF subfamily)